MAEQVDSFNDQHGQANRQLAKRLAAYLPSTLTRQILRYQMTAPGEPQRLQAATLFADISGFTQFSEALAGEGPQGGELLNRALLLTFTPLINAIHDAGGAVSHFHGDAMMVYFPDDDGQAAKRALATAGFMQNLVMSTPAAMTRLTDGRQMSLTIKIGVGYGRCLELIVGHPQRSLEFVLFGPAIDEASRAEDEAKPGQVIASAAALTRAGLRPTAPFQPVTRAVPVPDIRPRLYWEAYDADAIDRVLAIAPAFIAPALAARLRDANAQFVSDHRPATTMFVRLEGIDPANPDAGAQWQAYYEWACDLVARYGGENSRVNRVLTGDKGNQLHIIFGAPIAPDAPEAALRCALALQRERPPFIQRQQISVAAGLVYAGAVGSQSRREYTVVGSVVNLSARLTAHCPEGGVVIDDATARRVQPQFECDPLTAVTIKGHAKPVKLFLVRRERSRYATASGKSDHSLLLARAAEQARMVDIIAKVQGGSGHLLCMTGGTGTGLRELSAFCQQTWAATGGRVLVGIGEKHRSEIPFGAWHSLWREFWELGETADPQHQMQQVLHRASILLPNSQTSLAPWLMAMGLPLPMPLGGTRPLDSGQLRLFALIAAYLRAAATQTPLLLVLQDWQWADQPSGDLLHYLAEQLADSRLLLLVTERGTAVHSERLVAHADAELMRLGELTLAQARQVAAHYLGLGMLPPEIEQRLGLREQQGTLATVNPFFLSESLKAMVTAQIVQVQPNGRIDVDQQTLSQMRLPDTIHTWLLTRLDQLSPAGRGLLQVAAVIGREFTQPMLVAITPGMTTARASALLAELCQAELLEQVGDRETYLFRNAAVHDVVYQSLPFARRQAIHNAVADWLLRQHGDNCEPFAGLLAYHFGQANRPDKALLYAQMAAQAAMAVYAHREAAELYRLAYKQWQAMGEKAEMGMVAALFTEQAQALLWLGQLTPAFQVAQQALKQCVDTGLLTESWPIRLLMAEICCYQGRFEQALHIAERVLRQMGGAVANEQYVAAELVLARANLARQSLDFARNHLQLAAAAAERLADTAVSLPLRMTWAHYYLAAGELALARQSLDSAVLSAMAVTTPMAMAELKLLQSQVLWRAKMYGAAETAVAAAVELARTSSPLVLAQTLRWRARLLCFEGHQAAAAADWQVVRALETDMTDDLGRLETHLLTAALSPCANVSVAQGLAALHEAQTILDKFPRNSLIVWQLRLSLRLADLHLYHDQPVAAAQHLRRAGLLVEQYSLLWWQPLWLYWEARLAVLEDQADLALLLLDRAATAVSRRGSPAKLASIRLWQAKLTEDDTTRVQLLLAALDAARRHASHPDRLACYREAGELLLAAKTAVAHQQGAAALAQVDAWTQSPADIDDEWIH